MAVIKNIPGFRAGKWTVLVLFLTLLGPGSLLWGHGWMSPPSAALVENPVPVTPEAVIAGGQVYVQFCANCHGITARGGSKEAIGIDKDPPDLRKRLASHPDGDFFWKIQQGRGDMPAFKQDLKDREIWQVIRYLRDLIK